MLEERAIARVARVAEELSRDEAVAGLEPWLRPVAVAFLMRTDMPHRLPVKEAPAEKLVALKKAEQRPAVRVEMPKELQPLVGDMARVSQLLEEIKTALQSRPPWWVRLWRWLRGE